MRRIFALFLPMLLFGLVACSTQRTFAVGDSTVHVITQEQFSGPNVTSVFHEKKDGKAIHLFSAAGPGIAHSLIYGGSIVGGAYLFGSNMPADETIVNNGSRSSATATSNLKSKGNNGRGPVVPFKK